MADRFEQEVQRDVLVPSSAGWGQFLDTSKQYRQIGPYGTSGALIVLTLAGRGESILARGAIATLRRWWDSYEKEEDEYAKRRFVQTPRLSLLNLALHLHEGTGDDSDFRARVQASLRKRLMPTKYWGDYWYSDSLHDTIPRPFPTSIALVSLSMPRSTLSPLDRDILTVADELEDRLVASPQAPIFERVTMATAILATKGPTVRQTAVQAMKRISLGAPPPLAERGSYFFDFEYEVNGHRQFGRDYFFVPTSVLMCLAGLMPGSPTSLRLMSEAIMDQIITNLSENKGLFIPFASERTSTLDQAWVALLLSTSLVPHQPLGFVARVDYWLRRKRRSNKLTDILVPAFALVAVTVASALLSNGSAWQRAVAAVAALIVGGLYASSIFRILLAGSR